jgi:hypothetical protein
VASPSAAVYINPAPIPYIILPIRLIMQKIKGSSTQFSAINIMLAIAYKAVPVLIVFFLPHFDIRLPAKIDEMSKKTA